MVHDVSTAPAGAALKADKLLHETFGAKQVNRARINQRHEVEIKLRLRFIGRLVEHAAFLKLLGTELPSVAVAANLSDAILFAERYDFLDD